jgi:hypothetical protein
MRRSTKRTLSTIVPALILCAVLIGPSALSQAKDGPVRMETGEIRNFESLAIDGEGNSKRLICVALPPECDPLPVTQVSIPMSAEFDQYPNPTRISITAGPAPFSVRTPADAIRPSSGRVDSEFRLMNVNTQQDIRTPSAFPTRWDGPFLPANTFRGNAAVLRTYDVGSEGLDPGFLFAASASANYYVIRYYRDRDGVIQACPPTLVAVGSGGVEFSF